MSASIKTSEEGEAGIKPRGEGDGKNSSVEEVDVSAWEGRGKFAIIIHDVFNRAECAALIERAELKGFERALVNIGHGRQAEMTDFRNSDRSIIDDPKFAELMWQRIRTATRDDPRLMLRPGNKVYSYHALGLNERLRFLRYDEGNYFAPHHDGCYCRGDEAGVEREGEISRVTCQLYLNDEFEGGATRFLDWSGMGVDVVPKTGDVLLFEHELFHEGSVVVSGRKYAIRTDVMYTNRHDYEAFTYANRPLYTSEEVVEEDTDDGETGMSLRDGLQAVLQALRNMLR